MTSPSVSSSKNSLSPTILDFLIHSDSSEIVAYDNSMDVGTNFAMNEVFTSTRMPPRRSNPSPSEPATKEERKTKSKSFHHLPILPE